MKLRALLFHILPRLRDDASPPRRKWRQDEFVFRSEAARYPDFDAAGTALPPHGVEAERARRRVIQDAE